MGLQEDRGGGGGSIPETGPPLAMQKYDGRDGAEDPKGSTAKAGGKHYK